MGLDAGQTHEVVGDVDGDEDGEDGPGEPVDATRRDHYGRVASRNVSGVSGLSVMLKTGRGGAIPAGASTA